MRVTLCSSGLLSALSSSRESRVGSQNFFRLTDFLAGSSTWLDEWELAGSLDLEKPPVTPSEGFKDYDQV